MVLEGVCDFNVIRQWNEVLTTLLPDARKRRRVEPRWLQVLEQWLWDAKDEIQQLVEAGWDGLTLLRGLAARAGLRGCQDFTLIVSNVVDRLEVELDLGAGPHLPMAHAAWSVSAETKLYALYIQHGGTPVTSSSSSTSRLGIADPATSSWEGEPISQSREGQTAECDESEEVDVDITSLMERSGVNKRWLKSRSRSRGRGKPREPRNPPPKARPGRPRETRESVNLGQCAREARARTNRTTPATSSTPSSGSAAGEPAARGASTRVGLTHDEAVQLWLLWLGITDDQNASPPGKLLPGFVEEVVTQSFLSYGAQDRLTLALGFTRLVQSLMTAIGRLMEQASCMDNTPRANAEQADDEEVEVEAESDETLMMQTSMDYEVTSFMQASDNEWYRLLQQLRASLEQQSKSALRENIMWLRRLIHYKCVDSTRGHLLGLLGGRAGELVALLAAAETAAGEVEAPRSMHYTKWCIEWWDKLSPHLQQARGSLAAMGRPPLNCDLPPVFRATGLPDSADEEDADTAEFKSPTDEEGMPGNTSGPVSGLPRGPPPAVPVSELPTDLVVRSLLSSAARANRDTGAGAHLRQPGPIVVESQPPQPSSPTSFELTAAAEAAEEREALARVQAEEEQIEDAFYERQIASFQATRAQEWDDWALFDAMQNPPKKRTRILQVTVQGGASSSTVQVPLSSDRAEIRLQVELGYASGDADTTQTTIPAAVEGGMPMGSAGSHWNAIEALGPEQLHNVYEQWARGDLSSETVSREYGPVVLEALQTEHLLIHARVAGVACISWSTYRYMHR